MSLITHPFADCGGNCAGYRQQIENGFFADFNGVRIQADDYIVGVFDNIPAPGGTDDVFAIRFHSALDPPPTRPLLVDGFPQSIGFFNISLIGDADVFSDPSLPIDLDLTDFDPQSPGILSDTASGHVDVQFQVATLSKVLAPPGDYEFDRDVDADDYSRWKILFGSTIDLAADGNGDMVVDTADYTIWRDNFGTHGNDIVPSSFNNVPEPPAIVSLLATVVTVLIVPAKPVYSYHLHSL